MSDDDRMDRARRIREMREGSRSDDTDGASTSDDTDGASTSHATIEEASTGADPGGRETAGGEDGHASPDQDEDADGQGDGDGDADRQDGGADDQDRADMTDRTDTADDTDTPATGSPESATDTDGTDTQTIDTGTESGENTGSDSEDDDAGMHIPGAEVGDVEVDVDEMARQAGLESVETGTDEASAGGASTDGVAAGVEGAAAGTTATSTSMMRVLEFTLGTESYCLDIEYIEEIVEQETITRVPNTPEHVEGVVDLRGQITTILDPRIPLDIDADSRNGERDLLVVFDPEEFDDQGAIGWVVDDVTQVMALKEDDINTPPIDEEHVNGVVDRDDEFVIWTTPKIGLDQGTG